MININKFAFCFFSSDINDVIRQEIELTKLSNIKKKYPDFVLSKTGIFFYHSLNLTLFFIRIN